MVVAAATTLFVARTFYGYMLVQTHGHWSAPLDDVFIHFDYARSTALGYPFQWTPGNGYSSGNTSLAYPFVLAAGWAVGFREEALMVFAAMVACTSCFALLLAARRLFAGLAPWTALLAPPALYCVGALDWSLWSGMEVALYLGVWGGALVAALDLADESERPRLRRAALALGLWGVALVTTRPEGATSVAVLGLVAAWSLASRHGPGAALAALVRVGGPAGAALALQAVVNRALTGESAAAGAIVKLIPYHPFLSPTEKRESYRFLLDYVIDRNLEHHFTDLKPWGSIVLLLAAVPLALRVTRRGAIILWASAISWFPVVALNLQVRWQNERYTMPAVAWLLLAAAMGVGALVQPALAPRGAIGSPGGRWLRRASALAWLARSAVAAALVAIFARHQASQMRDQIWFFGRASRNIRDQHLTAGKLVKELSPPPHRLLVGDAGALLYTSELPGLDLIGLGGYRDLPFARAGVHGLGATLELIERMPAADRPDVMALYPSWWGELPLWFGRRIAEVPVHGNVICGGSEKVIYRADWHALGTGALPRGLRPGERVADELDVADLVSERAHQYAFDGPEAGFAEAKILADPDDPARDLFDGGRRFGPRHAERYRLSLRPEQPTRLIVRMAPERAGRIELRIDGEPLGVLEVRHADGWRDLALEVPASRVRRSVAIEQELLEGPDWVDYHVWAVQAP